MELAVHVYTIPVPTDGARLCDAERVLSRAERARAERFHRSRDRERFVVAHGETRRLLALLSGADAAALEFTTLGRGKPIIASPDSARQWMFNLSHSGEFALLAAALGAPLGVDIEEKRPLKDLEQVAERFFSPAERSVLAKADEPSEDLFFAIWTRKEAVIKTLGHGLAMPLAAFDVCEPGHWHTAPIFRPQELDGVSIPGDGWQVHALAVPPGYAGALATVSALPARLRRYPQTPVEPRALPT